MLQDNDDELRGLALAALQEISPIDQGVPEKLSTTPPERAKNELEVQCLGLFRVFKDGKEVAWRAVRARDLFAYLVQNYLQTKKWKVGKVDWKDQKVNAEDRYINIHKNAQFVYY